VLAISGVLYVFVRSTPSAVELDGQEPTSSANLSWAGNDWAADRDELSVKRSVPGDAHGRMPLTAGSLPAGGPSRADSTTGR
jgi:hypothetical protein